ncbi:hypothetical protein AcV5_003176 [Taiwanofungus camphoratus]|nr:hypothetical protein AcV5_003176 [Antrodia cinnamomea]
MSRHFCCCIPVRAAVFVFSFLSCLAAAVAAALAWYLTYEVDHHAQNYTNVTEDGKIMVIVVGVLFTIVALISLFGYGVPWSFCSAPRRSDTSPDMRRFIGSISRNRRFVKAYSALMWLVFFISLAASGLFLYVIYSGKALLRDCSTTDTQGNTTTEQCDLHPSVWMKVVVTVAVFCHLMLHLYIVVVIRRYVEQLEEDGEAWRGSYKLTSTEVNQGLLNPQPSYPYADASHSFGNV